MIAVYILFSEKDKRTYVGSTSDINRRILEHQGGKVVATRNRLPIKLIYFEKFDDLSHARKREQYYKSCAGRKKLKLILSKIDIIVQVPRLDSRANASRSGSHRHMKDKIKHLESELKKYKEQLIHMSTEFAATKSGSSYGVEYYEIQCRVLQSMIESIQLELFELKKKKS